MYLFHTTSDTLVSFPIFSLSRWGIVGGIKSMNRFFPGVGIKDAFKVEAMPLCREGWVVLFMVMGNYDYNTKPLKMRQRVVGDRCGA